MSYKRKTKDVWKITQGGYELPISFDDEKSRDQHFITLVKEAEKNKQLISGWGNQELKKIKVRVKI